MRGKLSDPLERLKAKAIPKLNDILVYNDRFKQSYYMLPQEYGETGIKILAAAEELFAEFGYHGVTLRQITAKAGVNLAAINYHHSDKQSLYLEILTHRLRMLNQVRLARLVKAESRSANTPVPLAELIDIMARPLLLPEAPDSHGPAGRRLLGRVLIEPLPFTAAMLTTEFQPAMTRLGQAIRRHLPGLAPEVFLWRLSFVVGALHHAAAALHNMNARTSGICRDNDAASALENFCEFAQATLPANAFR